MHSQIILTSKSFQNNVFPLSSHTAFLFYSHLPKAKSISMFFLLNQWNTVTPNPWRCTCTSLIDHLYSMSFRKKNKNPYCQRKYSQVLSTHYITDSAKYEKCYVLERHIVQFGRWAPRFADICCFRPECLFLKAGTYPPPNYTASSPWETPNLTECPQIRLNNLLQNLWDPMMG